MIKKNIKYLCKLHNIRIKDFEKIIGIKNSGLSRAYFYKSIKLSTISKIAEEFKVPLVLLVNCDLSTLTKEDVYNIFEENVLYLFEKGVLYEIGKRV